MGSYSFFHILVCTNEQTYGMLFNVEQTLSYISGTLYCTKFDKFCITKNDAWVRGCQFDFFDAKFVKSGFFQCGWHPKFRLVFWIFYGFWMQSSHKFGRKSISISIFYFCSATIKTERNKQTYRTIAKEEKGRSNKTLNIIAWTQ